MSPPDIKAREVGALGPPTLHSGMWTVGAGIGKYKGDGAGVEEDKTPPPSRRSCNVTSRAHRVAGLNPHAIVSKECVPVVTRRTSAAAVTRRVPAAAAAVVCGDRHRRARAAAAAVASSRRARPRHRRRMRGRDVAVACAAVVTVVPATTAPPSQREATTTIARRGARGRRHVVRARGRRRRRAARRGRYRHGGRAPVFARAVREEDRSDDPTRRNNQSILKLWR